MHWPKAARSDPQQQRPYQGVRVKEPVKELLRRKRGNISNTICNSTYTMPATTVVLPHQPLSAYSTIDPHCLDLTVTASSLPTVDEGSLYTGWISQPSSTPLQPLAQWATCTDYIPHEAVSCPYTGDMYVQSMCPSYAVVGPSSVLTYSTQPLLTNFASRTQPSLEFSEQQAPLTYFQPYYQPISTLPTSTLQYPSPVSTVSGPSFTPFPFSISDVTPLQQLDEPRRDISPLPIEKLLQENASSDACVLNNVLSVEGF